MIKVEQISKEIDRTMVIYFESRTTDTESLSDLDSIYEVLMSNLRSRIVAGGYDNSSKFFIELKLPS